MDIWAGFHAAHIFPIDYHTQWENGGFNRWFGINSAQNGMLMQANVHAAFDQYLWSIDPHVSVSFIFDL